MVQFGSNVADTASALHQPTTIWSTRRNRRARFHAKAHALLVQVVGKLTMETDMRDLDGMKVAVLVADGFEQVEMVEPKRALEQAGAQAKIVSPVQGEVQGWNHFDKADKFKVDVPLDQARA